MSQPIKRALVLGCGGVAGGAWSIASLQALQNQLSWDPRTADLIVGTSVGAVLAAMLGAGVSVDQLIACQSGESPNDCVWDHDHDSGGALPPRPALRMTSANLLMKALRGQLPAMIGLCGLVPRGRFDMTPFRALIDGLVTPGQWASRDGIWIMAVDTANGQRVAFGRDDAPECALNDAVCASYGVPAWCPPVSIAGREYFDGGVASPTSADLLCDSDVDEVIILAPMSSQHPDQPSSALEKVERRVRKMMTRRVDKEVSKLEQAGKRVIRLDPTAEDLQAIGYNMMDPRKRAQVFATAQVSAPIQLQKALSASPLSDPQLGASKNKTAFDLHSQKRA
ncbi:MAG: patatin-like phospholipase family protein [Oceanococcus sp.]